MNALIIVYNCSDNNSWQIAVNWADHIRSLGEIIHIAVCANFCQANDRVISSEEGQDFAKRINSAYYEISSDSTAEISEMLLDIVLHLMQLENREN